MKKFITRLPKKFVVPNDAVGRRILEEYGALFVARGGAVPPNTVIFKNESEVSSYQSGLSKSFKNLGGFTIELQAAAMSAITVTVKCRW